MKYKFPVSKDVWEDFWGFRFSDMGESDTFVDGLLNKIAESNCPGVIKFSSALLSVWKPEAIDTTKDVVVFRSNYLGGSRPPIYFHKPVNEEYFHIIDQKNDRAFRYFFDQLGNYEYYGCVCSYGFDVSVLSSNSDSRFGGETMYLYEIPNGDSFVINSDGLIGIYSHESNTIRESGWDFEGFLGELGKILCK